MAGFDVTIVVVYFNMNGTPMEVRDQANVKEVFVTDMERPALHTALNGPIVKRFEPSLEEMMNEDSTKEDMPMIRASLMVMDEEEQLERRIKRSREEEDYDEGPLILDHFQRAKIGDVLETSDDSENL